MADEDGLADESSPNLMDDLSFSDLSLLTSPVPQKGRPASRGPSSPTLLDAATRSAQTHKRPSASARPPVSSNNSRFAPQGVRLLQGVARGASDGGQAGDDGAAGGGRAQEGDAKQRRMSLFAPRAIDKHTSAMQQQRKSSIGEDEHSISILRTPEREQYDPASWAQSSGAARGGAEAERSQAGSSSVLSGPKAESAQHAEGEEYVRRQLDELEKMNATFEAYERMLQGSAGQIELFSHRLSCTSELLTSYMDLLLRSSDHQSLLLSDSWQGQTKDYEEHLAETARLEEELERRRRKREQEEVAEQMRAAQAAQQREEQQRRQAPRPTTTRAGATARGRPGVARGRGAAPSSSSSLSVRGAANATSSGRGGPLVGGRQAPVRGAVSARGRRGGTL
ncbi:unnamed protein product [Parajaminaea phylloscopi]